MLSQKLAVRISIGFFIFLDLPPNSVSTIED